MSRFGTRLAFFNDGKKERRTPGTEGLPPRPHVRRDELPGSATQGPSPVGLGLSTPHGTLPVLNPSNLTPQSPFTASLLPQERRSFYCELQISNCRLQTMEIRMEGTALVCLSICNLKSAICNLQSAICSFDGSKQMP